MRRVLESRERKKRQGQNFQFRIIIISSSVQKTVAYSNAECGYTVFWQRHQYESTQRFVNGLTAS